MTFKYSKKVMQHFLKPKNVGVIKNADGIGKITNDACGDLMYVYIKVGKRKIKGKEREIIKDAKFQTLGCPAAISASDILCEIVKGKSLEDAEKIDEKNITKSLGGLPPIKAHCSVMGVKTLREAIQNYKQKK